MAKRNCPRDADLRHFRRRLLAARSSPRTSKATSVASPCPWGTTRGRTVHARRARVEPAADRRPSSSASLTRPGSQPVRGHRLAGLGLTYRRSVFVSGGGQPTCSGGAWRQACRLDRHRRPLRRVRRTEDPARNEVPLRLRGRPDFRIAGWLTDSDHEGRSCRKARRHDRGRCSPSADWSGCRVSKAGTTGTGLLHAVGGQGAPSPQDNEVRVANIVKPASARRSLRTPMLRSSSRRSTMSTTRTSRTTTHSLTAAPGSGSAARAGRFPGRWARTCRCSSPTAPARIRSAAFSA